MLSKYLRLFTLTGAFDATNNKLKDVSLDNQNGNGILCDFDYLYLAQHYPFANIFFLMSTLNAPLNVVPTVAVQVPYNGVGPVDEIQRISFSTVPDIGTYKITYGATDTSALDSGATASEIETALRLIAGLENVTVSLVGGNFDVVLVGVAAPSLLVVTGTGLKTSVRSKFLIEYFDGVDWREAVDVLDSTYGLFFFGMLQYTTRNKYGWNKLPETEPESSVPPELQGLYIDECYWLRISFVSDATYKKPNPLTKIEKLCYAFTTTEAVNAIDTDAPKFYKSFTEQPNKNNWVKEIITASEEMVLNLKEIGFIKSAGEIVELDELYLPCAWKTLEHIYTNMGKAYETDRAIMVNKYEKALSSKALTFDKGMDGKIDDSERNKTQTKFVR